MIYGMYLSATGIITNTHRQDVIANNLANADTAGFKRQLVRFREAEIEAMAKKQSGDFNPPFDDLGGGQMLEPSFYDFSQGSLEPSSSPLDTAIQGNGFFGVQVEGQTRLTRNGKFMIDNAGNLVNTDGHAVLDTNRTPIVLRDAVAGELSIDERGNIQDGNHQTLATLGVFDVGNRAALRPMGADTLQAEDDNPLQPGTGTVQSGYIESSNVDPATEMTRLMETQRLLEANANLIKYQDQSVGRLITEVGKIS